MLHDRQRCLNKQPDCQFFPRCAVMAMSLKVKVFDALILARPVAAASGITTCSFHVKMRVAVDEERTCNSATLGDAIKRITTSMQCYKLVISISIANNITAIKSLLFLDDQLPQHQTKHS
jgi:hypothetical protein